MTTCHLQWNLPLTLPSFRDGATRLVRLAGRGMKGEGTCAIYTKLGLMPYGNSIHQRQNSGGPQGDAAGCSPGRAAKVSPGRGAKVSPGGAPEVSPGRQPWDRSAKTLIKAPEGRKRRRPIEADFLSPLRGLFISTQPHGSRRGLASSASPRLLSGGTPPNFRKALTLGYIWNAMNRAIGARGNLGWVTIPGAMPQADMNRAFGPSGALRNAFCRSSRGNEAHFSREIGNHSRAS